MMTINQEISHVSSSNTANNSCVKFVIWHTLRKLPPDEEVTRTVKLNDDDHDDNDNDDDGGRVNTCVLTHDWKVHLDVIEGDPRPIIARIEADFGPTFLRRRSYVWNRPRKMRTARSNNSNNNDNENDGENDHTTAVAWRCFESRQKCAGTPPILISIVGMGGTVLRVKYHPDSEPLEGYFYDKNISRIGATNSLPCLQPIPLPDDRSFSIEQVTGPVAVVNIDPENDMVLSTPNLRKKCSWERGEEGIQNIRQYCVTSTSQGVQDSGSNTINTIISIRLFEDSPDEKGLENLLKMAQNFVKYEDAIDKILQINRESRTLGGQMLQNEDESIKSNKREVEGDTNRKRHDKLASCSNTIVDLVKVLNPRKNQRYKLLLAREEQSRAFMAQFSFPVVPDDVDFTIALVRFCTLFVHNSFRFQKPNPLKSTRSIEYELEFLFSIVIRDRFVEETLLTAGRGQTKEHIEDDDLSFQLLCDFDIDTIDNDDVSIPVSVLHNGEGEDQCSDLTGSCDRYSLDGKRDLSGTEALNARSYKRSRPLTPPISNTFHPQESFASTNAQSLDVDVVFRSHLEMENKYYTAAKLAKIGKKLSIGKSNEKKKRLERLQDYFDARDIELKKCVQNTTDGDNSSMLGIEFVLENDIHRDDNQICMILKGGKQLAIPRRDVCKSEYEGGGGNPIELVLLPISEAVAKTIFEKLYPRKETTQMKFDDYIAGIDGFIDELQKDMMEKDPCCFALIHDLFCKH